MLLPMNRLDDNKKSILKKVNGNWKKLKMKKYGNKVRDQIVWKQVTDGAWGTVKSEMELEDY